MAAEATRRRGWRRYAFAAYCAAVGALIAVGLGLGALSGAVDRLGPLDPRLAEVRSTVVLDREGRLLRPFVTDDGRWRLPVGVDDVDPRFLALLVAFEDSRFRDHAGVDPRAVVRAVGQSLLARRFVSGASTLTMQVARLMEPRETRDLAAKRAQVLRALDLERRWSKRQILDAYLGLAPYGGNLEGVRAASLAWFGKEPKRLSAAEAALLVALPQSPETRRPDRFPEAARRARDRVLERGLASGVLGADEVARARGEPVPTTRRPFPMIAPHLAEDLVAERPEARIHRATIDLRLQTTLERLLRDRAETSPAAQSAALLVIDNASGELLASVGGPDYFAASRSGSLDLTQAIRSPGSALKPFIYALAFENGLAHPETILEDRPARWGAWAPENFDQSFRGTVTARIALQQSLNMPAVEVLEAIGPQLLLSRLRNAGADLVMAEGAPTGLAVGLGGVGIRLSDLARLYSGLARGGETLPIVRRLGEPAAASDHRRLTEPVAAWYVADILRGAPPPLNAPAGRLAFKTGTSYGFRDAWAVGFDRRVTIAVWVGRPDGLPVPGLVGRVAAAPILFDALQRLGFDSEPIAAPAGVLRSSTVGLPPPLRHLRRDVPKTLAATTRVRLEIAFPPDGARIDLGLGLPRLAGLPAAPGPVALKAHGGVPPLTWLVDGRPVAESDSRRDILWTPEGAGFARLSVIDATGASASVRVRVE
ncbi:penicillin-binding protein 1C [Siculibacillus lacustris]|uniref:peptidoglycan glycosyltransferase n=1 Tax=Siculibacillus lacustris TaxID=1549641 RepID=A0A4Q9VLB9_9HYPH|nr:penicillin-binding protein 1C [Siculibacillus lacustris]TBW35374.1 penicillin-binding protein 1C [Siculibacillus lacustris]